MTPRSNKSLALIGREKSHVSRKLKSQIETSVSKKQAPTGDEQVLSMK